MESKPLLSLDIAMVPRQRSTDSPKRFLASIGRWCLFLWDHVHPFLCFWSYRTHVIQNFQCTHTHIHTQSPCPQGMSMVHGGWISRSSISLTLFPEPFPQFSILFSIESLKTQISSSRRWHLNRTSRMERRRGDGHTRKTNSTTKDTVGFLPRFLAN